MRSDLVFGGLLAFSLGAGADAIYRTQIAPDLPRPESVSFSVSPDGQPFQEVLWYCKRGEAIKGCPIDYRTSTHALDPEKRWVKTITMTGGRPLDPEVKAHVRATP